MKPPTYFDHNRVTAELRGVEGYEERLAIVLRHVEANDRNFERNNAGFEFDHTTEAVCRIRRAIKETAEQLARGESSAAALSGTIQAWQVTLCEEYVSRGLSARGATAQATSSASADPEAHADADEESPAREPAPKRERPARKQAKPPSEAKTRKTPPNSPADDLQHSLFG